MAKILGQMAAAAIGPVLGKAFGIGSDQKQLKQQKKLQDLQISGQKEMSDYNMARQFDMWNKTNYGAQVEHMKKAGLNPALMYGMGGGGGATIGGEAGSVTGATASDASSRQMAETQMGMMLAQTSLANAQASKAEAEAKKIGGVDTDKQNWELELSKKLNTDARIRNILSRENWAEELIALKFEKENAEWEAMKSAGYSNMNYDNPDTPIAKAIKAGFEKTIEDAKQAKLNNDIKKAEKTIKEFEANLTKQGIAPNSPWYTKFVTDILETIGITKDLIKPTN